MRTRITLLGLVLSCLLAGCGGREKQIEGNWILTKLYDDRETLEVDEESSVIAQFKKGQSYFFVTRKGRPLLCNRPQPYRLVEHSDGYEELTLDPLGDCPRANFRVHSLSESRLDLTDSSGGGVVMVLEKIDDARLAEIFRTWGLKE